MFEPSALLEVINSKLNKENVHILTSCELTDVTVEKKTIKSITVSHGGRKKVFEADYFIDSTGDIVLARLAGCSTWMGAESKAVYKELSAPENEEFSINGVSYMFRVSRKADKDCLEDNGVNIDKWLEKMENGARVLTQLNYYPDGDISVNMLPTMTGDEYFVLDKEEADRICLKRVYAYWQYLKKNQELCLEEKGYHLSYVFPLRGIRESHRLVGKYVLTQNDLTTPVAEHPMRNRFIAYADHPMDTHGENSVQAGVHQPYGIPYDCLLTNEIDNMLVACRGASFSHLASTSCRLSRTMLRLGEAAAIACQRSFETGIELKNIDISRFAKCDICN